MKKTLNPHLSFGLVFMCVVLSLSKFFTFTYGFYREGAGVKDLLGHTFISLMSFFTLDRPYLPIF